MSEWEEERRKERKNIRSAKWRSDRIGWREEETRRGKERNEKTEDREN
jgi:hypothetical protein